MESWNNLPNVTQLVTELNSNPQKSDWLKYLAYSFM